MFDIEKFYSQYKNISWEELYEPLSNVAKESLNSLKHHEMYLEMLQYFRAKLAQTDKLHGKNYKKTLQSSLGVGEDGIYSNKLRFIYELIQNVDDCDYEDKNNCHLEIKFDCNIGQIILTYNEMGFTPFNVFAITGIAEAAKNISANEDKIEIGEKGIGFKSVFGIADNVLIQSGMFAFELRRDDFTVPIPCYNNFNGINGTRLIISIDCKSIRDIYRSIVERYKVKTTLLENNPILFLNKLTTLHFVVDSFRSIKFNVSRSNNAATHNGIEVETDVSVSVDVKDHYNGVDTNFSNSIICYRYTMPILYAQKECSARYGDEIAFVKKIHKLVAIIPKIEEFTKGTIGQNSFVGRLYSFFPTQIKLTVPIILHAPYKLDASREFVDPQNNNLWFTFTNDKISSFIKQLYNHLAHEVKENIVLYLPTRQYFFNRDNEKIACLQNDMLSKSILQKEALFYTVGKEFKLANEIISFATKETPENPLDVCVLLEEEKALFVPLRETNMASFGVSEIKDVYKRLFAKAVNSENITEKALQILDKQQDFNYFEQFKEIGSVKLTENQIQVFFSFEKAYEALNKYAIEFIKNGEIPRIAITGSTPKLDLVTNEVISEIIDGINFNATLGNYLKQIKFNYHSITEADENFYLFCKDRLILSAEKPLLSFANAIEAIDKRNSISSIIKMRQMSDELNDLDEEIGSVEYLNKLSIVRRSLVDIFGSEIYNNYIGLINSSGTDENRFINELLQNADDCQYNTDETPSFTLTIDELNLTTSYNEMGFTKQNVRAITAIGESTKKKLNSKEVNPIGEKGVGFKSVFAICNNVVIHSNNFHFKLDAKRPTVPILPSKSTKSFNGTKMKFELKRPLASTVFNLDNVLRLCLCLRKLKELHLGEYSILIDDIGDNREILITYRNSESKLFVFKKYIHSFTIEDEEALKRRENNQRIIDTQQEICIYVPENKMDTYYLYSGLPTSTTVNVPLTIDAPFEVSTSRDGVLHSDWNDIIRAEIAIAIIKMLHSLKYDKKIDIFRFIPSNSTIFSDAYLNEYDFREQFTKEEIVRIYGGKFVSTREQNCTIYPDVCLYLFNGGVSTPYSEEVVTCFRKQQYAPVLVWLGCKYAKVSDVISIIQDNTIGKIENESFRKLLYSFLKDNIAIRSELPKLPIIPRKPKQRENGVQYICNTTNLYISNEQHSTDEYCVLDTDILSVDDYYKIFGLQVKEMNNDARKWRYSENIKDRLNNISDKQTLAEWLINEFYNNRKMIEICKDTLIANIHRIPMKMHNGKFFDGNKCIDDKGIEFFGKIIPCLVVAKDYIEFAKFVGCTSIYDIHYDDIDVEVDEVTADDIEDILDNFKNDIEILKGYYDVGKISDDLIENYELWKLRGRDEQGYNDEEVEFPTRPILNYAKLKNAITEKCKNPNKFTVKMKPERIPERSINESRKSYFNSMYSNVCQCCKKKRNGKHIEIFAIQITPEYAWEEMHLNLCLECSKDFDSIRRGTKKPYLEDFIVALRNADLEEVEPIEIKIDEMIISFTATHLAEIKEILSLQEKESE